MTNKEEIEQKLQDPSIITCGLTIKNYKTMSKTDIFKDAIALLSHVLGKLPVCTHLKADVIQANGASNLFVQVKILTKEEAEEIKKNITEKKLDNDSKT